MTEDSTAPPEAHSMRWSQIEVTKTYLGHRLKSKPVPNAPPSEKPYTKYFPVGTKYQMVIHPTCTDGSVVGRSFEINQEDTVDFLRSEGKDGEEMTVVPVCAITTTYEVDIADISTPSINPSEQQTGASQRLSPQARDLDKALSKCARDQGHGQERW